MIEFLEIHNFQRHRNLSVRFGQITTICGPSDVGKSSVIRALRWLMLNKAPRGDFIHWGTDFAKVRLTVDGHTVVRSKGKANLYLLDGQRYQAFGAGVPDDVVRLLNVGEVSFQGQHTPSFWLSLTAGQVSRELNAIINLGLIDDALAGAAAAVRRAKAAEDAGRDRLVAAQAKRDGLSWVPDLDRRLVEIEGVEAKRSATAQKSLGLRSLLQSRAMAGAAAQNAAKALPGVLQATAGVERLLALRDRAGKLRKLLDERIATAGELARLRGDAAAARQELKEKTGNRCPICLRPLDLGKK